ncbi:glycosyltransferase family 39 protein [Radiomyces spectabilis]|uniref:glycosyltransferase family 39 protein n=1 Tax=Radiomyces spectabilis TaxID=64574 RepID=UPI00222002FE|nr:glycosyltransferase family 39 protein [Radiomyces spectabilis]KAI8379726.1 glycosyltransferase family 39 protein [Radiomyces spectabilis]
MRSPARQAGVHKAGLIVVTVLGFITTFYKIWYPAEVVFDEVHFGKFAGYYLQRSYFFDVHPPLAKLMIAAVGYLIGYDGHFDFANIGDSYIENDVPYIGLRSLPATLNVLNVALIYSIMKQSGYVPIVCFLSSCMYLLDNAIVAQHRLIMLDSMLIFYMLATIYAYIRFRKVRHQEFSGSWWFWLFATGTTMALTLSVKMVGLFLVAAIGISVLVDLWELFDLKRGLSMKHFMKHFYARAVGLIFIPIVIYLFWFHVHFAVLTESGPGDTFMSAAFQETLQNSAIKMKSLEIAYFDNITLKHKDTDVYLHSHNLHYPLRYDDGRISSQGQQVTGVKEVDDNCYWRVKPTITLDDEDERVYVRHGDIIQLEHIGTQRILLTHDVASPLMATNEEVTTVAEGERYNETLFQVLLDDHDNGDIWQTHMKSVRLLHMDTKVTIWTHDQALPDWALGQQEVNGNKNILDKSNYWIADEIMGMNGKVSPSTEINMEKKKELRRMPFLRKFFELQGRMLSHNAGLTKPHPYQSRPIAWPFMIRGISYWSKNDTREQIYMTGNLFGWYISIGSLAVFAGIILADTLARRRGIEPVDEPLRHRLINSGGFFVILWLTHYIPFFAMGRALFLHHYLPAAACNYLVLGAIFQFMFVDGVDSPVSSLQRNDSAKEARSQYVVRQTPMKAYPTTKTYVMAGIFILLQLAVFLFLAPITYGTPGLSVPEVLKRKVYSSWDLQYGKPTSNGSSVPHEDIY